MGDHQIDLKVADARIQEIKRAAEEIKAMGESFPALARNATRILASTKMLELDVSDVLDL